MHSVDICREVLEAAEEIHRALGPKLFRETYTVCLAMELMNRGYQVQTKRARLTPDGIDFLFIDDTVRIDISASAHEQTDCPVHVRRGSSQPITLSLNFRSEELLNQELRETLFHEVISIADITPFPPSKRLQ